ncbi:diaminopimelate decarboxylase [Acinetobacter baumannii]|nr:diaminopimelate decarboxylase [Acinetobacter baumannii]
MAWDVETTELFDSWLAEQDENAQDKILASLLVLSELGPNLGRPHVDTIKESKYPNMKEIRVQVKGHPIRGFLHLIQNVKPLFCVLEIRKG